MIQGLFEGNDPSDLQAAQTWLGANVGAVTAFSGQANWSDYVTSVGWEQGLWWNAGKTMLWSIPLFANGGNLHDAGTGAYDRYFTTVAQELAAGQSSGSIYVRTGWEFNGSWQTWSAINDPTDYIAAFRDFVTAFRAVSDRFVFTWAPNIGDQGMNPAAAYPGDQYVDIIGMDVYQQGASDTFSYDVNETYGLQWLADFAAAHGKPIAIPEWGVNVDSGDYVTAATAWMAANNVAYESYWDSNAAYAGKLSNGAMANAGAAFKAAFGGAGPVATSFTATGSGGAPLKATTKVTITVGFSKAVVVTGSPTLTLSNGKSATYSGGSGSSSLTFTYTVQAGDDTTDLQATGVGLPQGSSLTDAAGDAVSGAVAGDLALVIDTQAPTVTGLSAATSTGAAGVHPGDKVTITLTMSEAVHVTGSPKLVLSDGEKAVYSGGSGSAALSFVYTVAKGDSSADLQVASLTIPAKAAVSDLAGNALSGGAAGDLHLTVSTTSSAATPRTDFDGDGKADLLWRTAGGQLMVAESTHGWSASSTIDLGAIASSVSVAGIGDFDGDGKADLLLRAASGDTVLWESGHGLSSSAFVDLGSVSTSWSVAGVGDFDGDGKADILWRNTNGDTGLWESSKGLNGSKFVDLGVMGADWSVAALGDFDGDGKADILWRNSNGQIGLWESSHGLNSASLINLGAASSSTGSLVGVGDFDGDGKTDILVLSPKNHLVVWTLNDGLPSGHVDIGALPTGSHVAAIADFNGDGHADLLVLNDSGDATLWLSSGHGLGFTMDDLGAAPSNWQIESSLNYL